MNNLTNVICICNGLEDVDAWLWWSWHCGLVFKWCNIQANKFGRRYFCDVSYVAWQLTKDFRLNKGCQLQSADTTEPILLIIFDLVFGPKKDIYQEVWTKWTFYTQAYIKYTRLIMIWPRPCQKKSNKDFNK